MLTFSTTGSVTIWEVLLEGFILIFIAIFAFSCCIWMWVVCQRKYQRRKRNPGATNRIEKTECTKSPPSAQKMSPNSSNSTPRTHQATKQRKSSSSTQPKDKSKVRTSSSGSKETPMSTVKTSPRNGNTEASSSKIYLQHCVEKKRVTYKSLDTVQNSSELQNLIAKFENEKLCL